MAGRGGRTQGNVLVVAAAVFACSGAAPIACGGTLASGHETADGGAETESGPLPESGPSEGGTHDDALFETGIEGAPEASTMDVGMDEPVLGPTAPPTCSPPSGTSFTGNGSVTLSWPGGSPPPGGAIYYTTNGTNPNSGSTVYVAPITFGCTGSACPLTENIRAVLSAPGYND
jgi:hypothetical protein